jgi:hypothetical protein
MAHHHTRTQAVKLRTSLNSTTFACAALLVAAHAAPVAAAPNLEPGEWKITVQTDMSNTAIPGMPGVKIPARPAMTHNWCYQPKPGEDLGQNLANSVNRNLSGAKCSMLENSSSGNKVHYKMQCVSDQTGSATITGDFTIDGRKYHGNTQLDMQSPMGPMKAESTITGEYIGPCKSAAAG